MAIIGSVVYIKQDKQFLCKLGENAQIEFSGCKIEKILEEPPLKIVDVENKSDKIKSDKIKFLLEGLCHESKLFFQNNFQFDVM